MNNSELVKLCAAGESLYQRGYAFASTGNLSVRSDESIWITPTGCSLRGLTPEEIACVDLEGRRQNDRDPSKELPFHLAVYKQRRNIRAVVHLHSLHSVALSCLESLEPD